MILTLNLDGVERQIIINGVFEDLIETLAVHNDMTNTEVISYILLNSLYDILEDDGEEEPEPNQPLSELDIN